MQTHRGCDGLFCEEDFLLVNINDRISAERLTMPMVLIIFLFLISVPSNCH